MIANALMLLFYSQELCCCFFSLLKSQKVFLVIFTKNFLSHHD